MDFHSVWRTDVGCKRKLNEDSVLARDDLGLWAVADGMGGHEAGEVASRLVVDRLEAGGVRAGLDEALATARQALIAANAELTAMAGPEGQTIGSTVVAVGARAAGFWCLWAGDSRAFQWRDGVLRRLTRDHSLVQELVDAGILAAEDADAHPNANVIRRAVGAAPVLELDVVRGDVAPGDRLVLASDGVTRLVTEQELSEALADASDEAAADALVALCLARGAPDNLSFVVIRAS